MDAEERFSKIEKELSRARRVNLFLFAGFALLLVALPLWLLFAPKQPVSKAADGIPGEIRARSIIVEDDEGHPRIVLDAPYGNAQLAMMDYMGRRFASLRNRPCATLDLSDSNGSERISLVAFDGGGSLYLYDANGWERAHLTVSSAIAFLHLGAGNTEWMDINPGKGIEYKNQWDRNAKRWP